MSYLFKGKLLKLKTAKRRLPNGYTASLELIEHPGAVLIVPLLNKDEVIFIRQFRPVINSYIYELPAGTLEKGEKPIQCAKREIVEETGYAGNRFVKMGKIYPVPGYSTEVITIFKALQLTKVSLSAEPDEVIKICIFKRRRVRELFRKQKIVDAKTISALAFVGWL